MTIRKIHDQELPLDLQAFFRADAARLSARPEEFWLAQRLRIRASMNYELTRRSYGPRLALAAALVLCVALLVVSPSGPPLQVRSQPQVDADQQLLLSVERALAAGTPQALEPASLLVESSSARNDSETLSQKEQRNEN